MDLWRISNYRTLDGEGGRLAPGRWSSGGRPVVYLAASAAGALIEALVHLDLDDDELPRTYRLLHVSVPDTLSVSMLRAPHGEEWKSDQAITRKIGNAWLVSKKSVLARVPSAILPETFNYLLNPAHPDSIRVRIAKSQQSVFDPRLFKLHNVR